VFFAILPSFFFLPLPLLPSSFFFLYLFSKYLYSSLKTSSLLSIRAHNNPDGKSPYWQPSPYESARHALFLPTPHTQGNSDAGKEEAVHRRRLSAFGQAQGPVVEFKARPAFAFELYDLALRSKRAERTGQSQKQYPFDIRTMPVSSVFQCPPL
jgi:hypothetical protein